VQLRRSSTGARWVIALALLAALFSFAKFDHCRNFGWGAPDVYIHACYSDLPALYEARNLTHHAWPYSSTNNAVEYPPITGVVMWATTYLVGDKANDLRYFDINALLIALLFVGCVWLIFRIRPQYWYLLPLSPAVIASLYINWDLWAVASALLAISLFDKKRYEWSALCLALSISTKFFPIVLLLPIAVIFIRRNELKIFARYLAITFLAWLLINLPFILTTPQGWWRFFAMNSARGVDWGSIWYLLSQWGVSMASLNIYSLLLFAAGALAYCAHLLGRKVVPTLAQASFVIVAIFTMASKVYSPQYVLWLTPLAILALRPELEDRSYFWIWQGAELAYHLAIWEFLATQTGARFGAPAWIYQSLTALRIVALALMAWRLTRKNELSTTENSPQLVEFPSLA
jgi:hypothetical protein